VNTTAAFLPIGGSSPDVRWVVSPHDGRCHAFDPEAADGATERGYAAALCGHTVPGRLVVADAPSGALCWPCATLVASELPDPGPGGPPM
jgi:hypothetical protein